MIVRFGATVRRVCGEFGFISWSGRRETLVMTFVVIVGVGVSAVVLLSVDYMIFNFIKFIYAQRF